MNHAEKARELFLEGYNCAQAVLCSFDDLTGLDLLVSARLASSFGGGMGRLREVCGTVSGALMVLGLLCGYDDPKASEEKTAHYHLVQEFVRRFREINGTILCRDLLKGVKTVPGSDPEARTSEYYARRPCLRHVGEAAQIVEELIAERPGLDRNDLPSASAAGGSTKGGCRGSGQIQPGRPFEYNIFLIGFMGSGKTTISEYMRDAFSMEAVDMDEVISSREGMSITRIFEERGEEYFRNAETDLLIELQSRSNVIVSCGGGVPMREANVREMRKNGRIVLLTARPETVLERVKDSHDRPLIENNKTVGFIESLMEKRRGKYEAAADVIICTDGRTAQEICDEMVGKLSEPHIPDIPASRA